MPDDQFDPQRLVALARARDQRRAYAKSLGDRYQDLRAQRQDVQRRMELARLNAQAHHGAPRFEAEEGIKALQLQHDNLTGLLSETQAESDAVAEEAGEASRLLSSCLTFAHGRGLPIPPQLAQEAAPRTFAPLASAGGAA